MMLEKMGWKGQGTQLSYLNLIYLVGLGKYEQGIIQPLFAKKTNNKQGVIINRNVEPDMIDFNIKDYYKWYGYDHFKNYIVIQLKL